VIALIILVFVDAHDAATPLPGALARAAEEALGPESSVSVRALAGETPPATLVDAGRAAHATAVARISWTDARRAEARLEVVATDGLTRTSTIAFDASDPLAERGRALGLVLAALLAPEKQAHERERAARENPAAPPAASIGSASPPGPPVTPARRLALDAAVAGGFALEGAGSGVGGALGVRWHPGRRIGLRIGVGARFGEIRAAQAVTMTGAAAAGVVAYVIPPAEERRLALGLRADALLLYESLSHLSADDTAPARGVRLLPGAAARVEGQLAISATLALFLAGGAEIAFGRTDVFVHQEKVAELATLRLVVDGGLVARF